MKLEYVEAKKQQTCHFKDKRIKYSLRLLFIIGL